MPLLDGQIVALVTLISYYTQFPIVGYTMKQ